MQRSGVDGGGAGVGIGPGERERIAPQLVQAPGNPNHSAVGSAQVGGVDCQRRGRAKGGFCEERGKLGLRKVRSAAVVQREHGPGVVDDNRGAAGQGCGNGDLQGAGVHHGRPGVGVGTAQSERSSAVLGDAAAGVGGQIEGRAADHRSAAADEGDRSGSITDPGIGDRDSQNVAAAIEARDGGGARSIARDLHIGRAEVPRAADGDVRNAAARGREQRLANGGVVAVGVDGRPAAVDDGGRHAAQQRAVAGSGAQGAPIEVHAAGSRRTGVNAAGLKNAGIKVQNPCAWAGIPKINPAAGSQQAARDVDFTTPDVASPGEEDGTR